MLFKEIIAVYSENHTKPINTKCSITDCQSRWFIWVPLGLKGLILYFVGRYCLYSRWKNDTYQQHAKLLRKRGEAQKKIKSIMKRVSKENIKPVGRLIGKLTHCSPGFLFDYVCWNLEFYVL
jgi:hypothetical protein